MTLFDDTESGPTDPGADAGPGDPVRVRLVVAYHGAPFHGFADNSGVRTVGGDLRAALRQVLGHDVALTCAGRTDKGVHARAQVVTFEASRRALDLASLVKSLNTMCRPSIAVISAETVDADFDARFSATSRRYRYRVLNAPASDPLRADQVWHIPEPLTLAMMRLACDAVIGEHDFSAFCRRPKRRDGQEASLVRRVTEADWARGGEAGDELHFEIEASSFCHQMVRSIVGLMVDVGRGRQRAGDVRTVMASGERSAVGNIAPPHGLTLWTVRYRGWNSSS